MLTYPLCVLTGMQGLTEIHGYGDFCPGRGMEPGGVGAATWTMLAHTATGGSGQWHIKIGVDRQHRRSCSTHLSATRTKHSWSGTDAGQLQRLECPAIGQESARNIMHLIVGLDISSLS